MVRTNANAERAAGERLDEAMDEGPGRFVSGTRRRLEEFERIPVRIFDLDLTAPWTHLHLVADSIRLVSDGHHSASGCIYPRRHLMLHGELPPYTCGVNCARS
jgi:hypothetical protein